MSVDRRKFIGSSVAIAGASSLAALLPGRQKMMAGEDEQKTTPVDGKKPGKTQHTKFAVNIEMWWTKLDFMDRIKQAAEFGFPAVEFWPYANKDVDAVAKLCKELGLEIAQFTAWGFTPGMNNPANEEQCVKTITEACEIAHRLDCKKMTVVAGNNQKEMTQQQMLAQVTKTLKRAAPILEENKVMAILEPMNGRVDHPGHCLYGSTDALKICRDVDSPMVKINWDLYHMQITEGDLCGHLKEGIDQIGYLQLADHPGRHEPGTGEIHYNRVLQEAKKLGYDGFVGLECRPKEGELKAAQRVAAADIW